MMIMMMMMRRRRRRRRRRRINDTVITRPASKKPSRLVGPIPTSNRRSFLGRLIILFTVHVILAPADQLSVGK
jgi:hypothetical protein